MDHRWMYTQTDTRVGEAGFARLSFRAPLLPSRRRVRELPVSLSAWTGFATIVAAHQVEVSYEHALQPVGISVRDFVVIAEIAQRAGISQTALAERVGVGRSRLSDHLSKLEDLDLVERLLNPADLRRRRLWLTPEGHRTLAEAREKIATADRTWLQSLNRHERPLFSALLGRLLPQSAQPFGHIREM